MRRFLLASALLAACGDGGDASPTPTPEPEPTPVTQGLPCDVDRVLAANCRECHAASPRFGAPMALVTFDDLHATRPNGEKVYDAVARRIASDTAPMPPAPRARLGARDQGFVTDWASAGAPRSSATCQTAPDVVTPPSVTCTENLTLAPASPYAMPTGPDVTDKYVCWGVDLTRPDPTHIVGLVPRIDNTKIVHHVVVYEAPDAYSPTPTECNPTGSIFWRMVMAWAPGGSGLETPPEAGFPIAQTGATHYVVQMHYSNAQQLVGQTDASSIGVCTAPPRKYEADVLAFGTQDFTIPPGSGVYKKTCRVLVPEFLADVHFFGAMPHMHKLGVEMTTLLTPAAGGPPVDLGSTPRFDFNTQYWLPVSAKTSAGDTITTTCGWLNNTGAPVKFGEFTAEEMCYSFTAYYPRVEQIGFSWATPALLSDCD